MSWPPVHPSYHCAPASVCSPAALAATPGIVPALGGSAASTTIRSLELRTRRHRPDAAVALPRGLHDLDVEGRGWADRRSPRRGQDECSVTVYQRSGPWRPGYWGRTSGSDHPSTEATKACTTFPGDRRHTISGSWLSARSCTTRAVSWPSRPASGQTVGTRGGTYAATGGASPSPRSATHTAAVAPNASTATITPATTRRRSRFRSPIPSMNAASMLTVQTGRQMFRRGVGSVDGHRPALEDRDDPRRPALRGDVVDLGGGASTSGSSTRNLTGIDGAAPSTAAWLAVFAAAVFFGSVLLHEGAHAVMARSLGLPVLGVTLVFWGGATETKAHLKGARGEFLVAVVGPLTTLAVAGLLFVAAGATSGLVSVILHDLAGLNLLFAGLNALPGFPLDGGRVLMAGVWGATRSRRTGMRAAGYASIVVGGAMLAYAVYDFSQGGGYWLFLGYVGFILISTGRAMDQRIAFRDQLAKGTVAEAMRPPPPPIPASMTLSEALDHSLRGAAGLLPGGRRRRSRGGHDLARGRTTGRRTRPAPAGARGDGAARPVPHGRPGRTARRRAGMARRPREPRAPRRRPRGGDRPRRRRTLVPAGDRRTSGSWAEWTRGWRDDRTRPSPSGRLARGVAGGE